MTRSCRPAEHKRGRHRTQHVGSGSLKPFCAGGTQIMGMSTSGLRGRCRGQPPRWPPMILSLELTCLVQLPLTLPEGWPMWPIKYCWNCGVWLLWLGHKTWILPCFLLDHSLWRNLVTILWGHWSNFMERSMWHKIEASANRQHQIEPAGKQIPQP